MKKWTRGISVLLVLVLLAGILGIVGCAKPSPTPTPAAKPTPTPAPTTPAPSPTTPTPVPTTKAPTPTPTTPAFKPPSLISFAGVSVEGAGFIAGQAFGGVFTSKTGVDFRMQPTSKSRDRFGLIRSKECAFLSTPATDALLYSMGIDEANVDGWGPQTVRVAWLGDSLPLGYAVRANSNIMTGSDLKGKRITRYPGYPIGDMYARGLLGYFNIKEGEYTQVPVGSSQAGYDAILEGKSDCSWMAITSAAAIQLQSSPYGLRWIQLPPDNKEGWARLKKENPIARHIRVESGVGAPADLWGYNYHILAYSWQDEELVYWMTKKKSELYEDFKGKHTALADWTMKNAVNIDATWIPYHPGAIRYYKEIGVWTPAHDAFQQKALAEETQRIEAWKKANPTWKWNSGSK